MNIRISQEVRDAIKNKKAVISLESTIISHGMPYPQNVETGLMVEAIAREQGVIPCTIGIIQGQAVIGLTNQEIEYLGKKGQEVKKVSLRDLPIVLAQGLDGATTVSGTIVLSKMAGIEIFATGGIGGVHRDAQNTMDISRDLRELGSNNIAVVCAGAKSILDLELTMEYLETEGVTVIGYQTDELPAFYTRKSGIKLENSMYSADEVASFLQVKAELGLNVGTLITVPIKDEFSIEESVINDAINKALVEAKELGIFGKKITPFLLDRIKQITHGKSLESNIELVKNNVLVASKIAKSLENKRNKN